MQGKSIFTSVMVFWGLTLFSVLQPFLSEAKGDIFSAQQEIESLIKADQLIDAKNEIEQLKTNYSQDPCLPSALYCIAEQYQLFGTFDHAKDIHQQIIVDYPSSSYANRSLLGVSRADILSLITSGSHEQAEDALEELIADFSNHPDLPETHYWVGREFGWWNNFEKEKHLYHQVMQNHSDSQFATKALLDLSRAQVMSLIISKDYDSAQGAYVELVSDFSEHPDLSQSLYRIGKIWVWSGNNCVAANAIYQKIIQDHPGSTCAEKSQTYLQITQEAIDIFALIESEQEQSAQIAIEQLVTDFSGHELLPHMIFMCGEKYFNIAFDKRNEGLENEAGEDFEKAIEVWKVITEELPVSGTTPEGYYHLAIAYRQLSEYTLAIEYYTRVIEDYPDYRLAWEAQFMIGHTYEQLLELGLLPGSEAKPLIALAYHKVLDQYPDCMATNAAKHWLEKSGNYKGVEGNGVVDGNDID